MKKNIDFKYVNLDEGFWKKRYELNKEVSLKAVYNRFLETGRIKTLTYTYQKGDKVDCFYDSDTAKWIEAVGYLIEKDPNGLIEEQKVIDKLAHAIKLNQTDGYVNSYFQQVAKDKIFKDRLNHELYSMGHLIEAGISYDRATHKHTLLECCEKMADCINKTFVVDKTASFCCGGHEEIELALIKLYNYTKKHKYLDLAMHFINTRGTAFEPCYDFALPSYDQHDKPAREIESAEGHAVRAVYFYTGMADAAYETNDKELFNACEKIFDNIKNKKVYITGGIGSSRTGEAFTSDYDLPNIYAYSESCAAIGLILFCLSMQKLSDDVKYPDMIERVMYNNLLSSTSLDGKSFFYENPLEIKLSEYDKEKSISPNYRIVLPLPERKAVFGCSCCPPNINRIFAKIGDLFFSENKDILYINQFSSVSLKTEDIEINMFTQYPIDGKIKFNIVKNNKYNKLYIRKPFWCDKYEMSVPYKEIYGYLVVDTNKLTSFEINYFIKAEFVEANPLILADNGRVALTYGPIVYCLEGVDNKNVNQCSVKLDSDKELTLNKTYMLYDINVKGYYDSDFDDLYRKIQSKKEKVTLKFIPYYTFANRGKSDMQVWVRKEDK